MIECVIVAVPRADDYTHKISSEKIPHMTLLYLGEVNDGPTMARIASFVEHASEELDRFGLDVDRRGTLGDDEADVLFFKTSYTKKIEDFRKNLLMNNDIRAAYETAMQYPQWTPHLTLGYPDAPAKEMNREYGINWVEFDRIAVWFGNFEGPEFQLEDNSMSYDEVAYAMNDEVEDFLAHYGVKGMKWGKRKDRSSGESSGNLRTHLKKTAVSKIERDRDTFKALRDKTDLNVRGKTINALNRATMGQKLTEKYYDYHINRLDNKASRIKSGEATVLEKFDAVLNLPVRDIPRVQKRSSK